MDDKSSIYGDFKQPFVPARNRNRIESSDLHIAVSRATLVLRHRRNICIIKKAEVQSGLRGNG